MKVLDCIDAGTEYCPCHLAEKGECIMCSQLQGKSFCDCVNWKGVCIYQEYIWNQSHNKESRKTYTCEVLNKEQIAASIYIFKIKVNRTLTRELNQPGAYVFLRSPNDPLYFDMPMSIMKVDKEEETINIVVQERGVKTKSLLEAKNGNDKEVLLRGPFWNGVLGVKYIKGFRKGKALLLVRGIGQAPALLVANKILQGGSSVEVILDRGKAGVDFTKNRFEKMGCHVINKKIIDEENLTVSDWVIQYVRNSITNKGTELIYSGGPEILHYGIGELIKQMGSDVYFTCSNNMKLCCGEGICGSCQTRLIDGKRVKTCKTQFDPIAIYGGR
ncbi:MAG: sulfide/dihydroorotate dehydrogenase-like FAD/NAD-binding protein [Clostridia bacterium]|nr:sulfide/dihydroorotate dehydrogenase-like FAD/NAD-binding protein [Clostridia bacterium]MDD4049087.1 sulfide/dihydroorotate dehydrogenase-like FAD/NAD-binding protein [Clostridia bacterium]